MLVGLTGDPASAVVDTTNHVTQATPYYRHESTYRQLIHHNTYHTDTTTAIPHMYIYSHVCVDVICTQLAHTTHMKSLIAHDPPTLHTNHVNTCVTPHTHHTNKIHPYGPTYTTHPQIFSYTVSHTPQHKLHRDLPTAYQPLPLCKHMTCRMCILPHNTHMHRAISHARTYNHNTFPQNADKTCKHYLSCS